MRARVARARVWQVVRKVELLLLFYTSYLFPANCHRRCQSRGWRNWLFGLRCDVGRPLKRGGGPCFARARVPTRVAPQHPLTMCRSHALSFWTSPFSKPFGSFEFRRIANPRLICFYAFNISPTKTQSRRTVNDDVRRRRHRWRWQYRDEYTFRHCCCFDTEKRTKRSSHRA